MGKVIRMNPDQPELDVTQAHARRTDPETSHDAAERITPELKALQALVLHEMKIYAPCTDRKLVTVMKAKHGRTDSTWRTRRSELVRMGLVHSIGRIEGHTIWAVVRHEEEP